MIVIREIIESNNDQFLVGRHGTFDKASHTYKLSSTMYIRKSKVAERLLTAGLASTGLPVKFKLIRTGLRQHDNHVEG